MLIFIAADHRGLALKDALKPFLTEKGYEVVDLGANALDPKDDYPDFAEAVGKKISLDPDRARGILICAGGSGVCIAANKFKNVRATIGMSPDHVYAGRHDDDINVLCFASDFTDVEAAKKMVDVFIMTPFGTDERFKRRTEKISKIENG